MNHSLWSVSEADFQFENLHIQIFGSSELTFQSLLWRRRLRNHPMGALCFPCSLIFSHLVDYLAVCSSWCHSLSFTAISGRYFCGRHSQRSQGTSQQRTFVVKIRTESTRISQWESLIAAGTGFFQKKLSSSSFECFFSFNRASQSITDRRRVSDRHLPEVAFWPLTGKPYSDGVDELLSSAKQQYSSGFRSRADRTDLFFLKTRTDLPN